MSVAKTPSRRSAPLKFLPLDIPTLGDSTPLRPGRRGILRAVDAVDAIKRGFGHFNRRDWDAIARGLPEDFEAIDRAPVDVLRARGPYALKTITDANGDTAFADLRMEVLEAFTVELRTDVVLVVVRVAASARGGESGAPVEG